MAITAAILTKIKFITNETNNETLSDSDITYVYEDIANENINLTISEIALKKALLIHGGLTSYSIGGESYSFNNHAYDNYMLMYKQYKKLGGLNVSKIMSSSFDITEDNIEIKDYDQLMGGKYNAENN